MKLIQLLKESVADDIIIDFLIDAKLDTERLKMYIYHSVIGHRGVLNRYLMDHHGFSYPEAIEATQSYFKENFPEYFQEVLNKPSEYDDHMIVGTPKYQEWKQQYLERKKRMDLLNRFSDGDESAFNELFGIDDDD